jgi:hypothetical protein
VAPTFEDKSTFWMSFTDFASAFNRFFITRLFPPSWHQLTLHAGTSTLAIRACMMEQAWNRGLTWMSSEC